MNLDWASDPNHDAAKHAGITSDQLSRIALGAYNFNCDRQENTPFNNDNQHTYLKARDDAGHIKPDLPAIDIDWYSAKHELLTLYYCFQVDHRRLKLPLKWAAASTLDPAASASAKSMIHDALDSLDQEAVRLHFFLTLGAQRIEISASNSGRGSGIARSHSCVRSSTLTARSAHPFASEGAKTRPLLP